MPLTHKSIFDYVEAVKPSANTHTAYVIDVSSSLSARHQEIVRDFIEETPNPGDVVLWDTKLKTFVPKDIWLDNSKTLSKSSGRGGTDIVAALDWLHKSYTYQTVIVFTDGEHLMPPANTMYDFKLVWVFYNKHAAFPPPVVGTSVILAEKL